MCSTRLVTLLTLLKCIATKAHVLVLFGAERGDHGVAVMVCCLMSASKGHWTVLALDALWHCLPLPQLTCSFYMYQPWCNCVLENQKSS